MTFFNFSNHISEHPSIKYLPFFILILFSIGIYAGTLYNGFVYDDEVTIVENPQIKHLGNLSMLFDGKDYFELSKEMTYRPVVTFTYLLEYALFGLKPLGFHLTNIMLHTLNGVLLYLFLIFHKRSPKGSALKSAPFLATLIFIAHPALTEAVNVVSFREDLLVFFFIMATLNLYIRSKTPLPEGGYAYLLYLISSCITYLLALLSKETALTFLLTIFCYEWTHPKGRETSNSKAFNIHIIGYAIVTIIYIYIRFHFFYNPVEQNIPSPGLFQRAINIPWLIFSYLKLSILPVSLSADYLVPDMSLTESLSFFIPFAFLSAIIFVLNWKGKGTAAFGLLFFVIYLIPVFNIIPISNPLAERCLYLPIAGAIIAIESTIRSIKAQVDWHRISYLYLIIFFAGLIVYSLSVVHRNEIWKDNKSLWQDTVKKMPKSWRAHNNLGNVFYTENLLDEAVREQMTAITLKPDYAEAYNNLGAAYYSKGQLKEATENYMATLDLNPDHAAAHNNLGLVYKKQGKIDDAVLEYKTALGLNPYDAKSHYNLGLLYIEKERLGEAIKELQAAIHLKPDNANYYNWLGIAYVKQGKRKAAVLQFQAAIRLQPDHPDALNNMGIVYISLGRVGESINLFRTALKLSPKEPKYYNGLGQAYFEQGNIEESIRQFQQALKLSPDLVEAHFNLGIAFLSMGSTGLARKEFETVLDLKPDHVQAGEAIASIKKKR